MAIKSVLFARHHGAQHTLENAFNYADEQVIDLGGSEVLPFLQQATNASLSWARQSGAGQRFTILGAACDVIYFTDTAVRLITNEPTLLAQLQSHTSELDIDIIERSNLQCVHFSGPKAADLLSQHFGTFDGMVMGSLEQLFAVQCNNAFLVASADNKKQYYRAFASPDALSVLTNALQSTGFDINTHAA